jgi:2-oxoisovalerate dehydrogenase E2 component (dihydrolipoyl transacylase)
MTSITMPQLGESVAEGTIGRWLKAAGERIERDEPLVEVITDKVTAEIPSPVGGVVEKIVVEEGQTVPVGREIAVIAQAGAEGDGSAAQTATSDTSASVAERPGPPPEMAAGEATASATLQAPPSEEEEGEAGGEQRRASPLVRRLAREHNVDLSQVRGSGAGGRVTKDDIVAFVESRGAAPAAAAAAPPSPAAAAPPPAPLPEMGVEAAPAAPVQTGVDEEYVALSAMRRTIAEHMVRSKQVSPDAWGLVEVDVTGLARLRESLQSDWQRREGFELTFLPFFIKSVVESLREHPILNSSWGEDRIILKKRINVGVAVAVEDGLVVPVIHEADQKSIVGLAHSVRDLAARARAGKLGLPDIQSGTFTVNNTGALGSIMSAPIINQPQAAIITMEAIVKRPVVLDDAIAIRSMMNVCLSFDHRILDGAAALRFLQSTKRRLEAYGPGTAVY